jgi:uncharacterized protein
MFELPANHQGHPVKPQPLTVAEFERLSGVLGRFDNKHPMNIEQLDGFLAALICGPELVPPSEYLPVIWGDNLVFQDAFKAQSVLQDFLSLVIRHSNVIADTLHSGEVFLPLLLEDDSGVTHANDWATGFLRGMEFHKEQWAALLGDEEHGGWLVPIFALAHEHDPDPEMRPYKEAISAEKREELIVSAAAGVIGIYHYFQEQRSVDMHPLDSATTFRRTLPKIGRNDPCPCGSGKKFKQCCGRTTLH